MQSGLPVFVVGKFGNFEIFFCKNDCLVKPDFSYFSNYKHQKWTIFGQNMIMSSCLLITYQYFDSGLFIKATSHSTIFDIPMRPLREKHRHRFTR